MCTAILKQRRRAHGSLRRLAPTRSHLALPPTGRWHAWASGSPSLHRSPHAALYITRQLNTARGQRGVAVPEGRGTEVPQTRPTRVFSASVRLALTVTRLLSLSGPTVGIPLVTFQAAAADSRCRARAGPARSAQRGVPHLRCPNEVLQVAELSFLRQPCSYRPELEGFKYATRNRR